MFHISENNKHCGYSFEWPCPDDSNKYVQNMFLWSLFIRIYFLYEPLRIKIDHLSTTSGVANDDESYYGPRSDKRDLMVLKVKGEIFTGNE